MTAHRPLPRRRRAARGFTLIEVLVVVALIAIAATAVALSVGQGLEGARVRSASKDLVAALRYTRGQAIVQRAEQVLEIDVDKRVYRAPGREPRDLPDGMELRVLGARQEQVDEGTVGIRFFPDGSSTGGVVTLVSGQAAWIIEVQWLTGEAMLRQGEATP